MAKKRLHLLLVGVVAVLIGLLIAAFHGPPEPSYGGKKLSEWLDGYSVNRYFVMRHGTAETAETDAAIRQIGSNAVPYLLEWMRCERPAPWREKLFIFFRSAAGQRLAGRVLGIDKWLRTFAAAEALQALGPQAVSAVGGLIQMLNDTGHPDTRRRAEVALVGLGSVGVPLLTAALTNQQFAVEARSNAAHVLMLTSNGEAVSRSFLTNSDPVVRDLATNVGGMSY